MARYLVNGFLIFLILFLSCFHQDDFYTRRQKMVKEQIEERGITHSATLLAMRKVERHLFVPENQENWAYDDRPLPIGSGQTISQPFMVAYMTAVIDPNPKTKILEIGTGSGYQAAVLAEIADSVYTVEIIEDLAINSRKLLTSLGYPNILFKYGDGYEGWKEHAPFDGIIVTAAPEAIPEPLLEQLKEGGKMVIPVGSPYRIQELILITKKNNRIIRESLFPVRFVPFTRD